jgi:hypothetical protein
MWTKFRTLMPFLENVLKIGGHLMIAHNVTNMSCVDVFLKVDVNVE